MVVRSDSAGGSGSAKSSGFNWGAGNLSLQPSYSAPRESSSVTPTQQKAITSYQQAQTTNPSPAQAPPTTYGYAPALNGGQGININAPLSAPAQQSYAPPAAPPPPPAPIVGGRQWYEGLDSSGRQAADQKWLGGDSDYTAQIAEYDKALQSFIGRIADQRKGFTEDANLATAATDRNAGMTLNNLGEDFGARGLSYSGLFDTTKNETNQRFNEAKSGIERMRSKNDTDALNRQKDYQAENAISKSNAQRASLGREAQRQALIDSMGGL